MKNRFHCLFARYNRLFTYIVETEDEELSKIITQAASLILKNPPEETFIKDRFNLKAPSLAYVMSPAQMIRLIDHHFDEGLED